KYPLEGGLLGYVAFPLRGNSRHYRIYHKHIEAF
ncbi:unnamed protein product, partial [marine sediment metagenome]